MTDILAIADATIYGSLSILFLTLGILVSIRFTGFPDLTVDGSYTLGAATYVLCIYHNIPYPLALLLGCFSGFIAGCLTAFLNKILGIGKIMSSVIIMILIILIIPYFGIDSTISLLNSDYFISNINSHDRELTDKYDNNLNFSFHVLFSLFYIVLFIIFSMSLYYFFSKNRLGLQLRYVGSAKNAGLISKVRRKWFIFWGLGIGNMLVAIGGIIEAERKGGFNIDIGQGMILTGIATLILGESIVRLQRKRIYLRVYEYLVAIILGSIIYSFGIQLILYFTSTISIDLKLTSTLLLLLLLIYSSKKFSNSEQLF